MSMSWKRLNVLRSKGCKRISGYIVYVSRSFKGTLSSNSLGDMGLRVPKGTKSIGTLNNQSNILVGCKNQPLLVEDIGIAIPLPPTMQLVTTSSMDTLHNKKPTLSYSGEVIRKTSPSHLKA